MPETTCNVGESGFAMLYATCPDLPTADAIARAVVGEGLAACANILPGMRSVYRWQGRVESAEEAVLLLKADRPRAAALLARVAALHPYEVPCIVELPLGAVHGPFAAWIRASTSA